MRKCVTRLNTGHRCLTLYRLTHGILQFCNIHDMRDYEEPLSHTGKMSLLCRWLWVLGLEGSTLTDVWKWTLALPLMTLRSGNIYWLCSEKAVDGLWVQLSSKGLSPGAHTSPLSAMVTKSEATLALESATCVFSPTLRSKLYTKCKYQLCYQIQLYIIILNGQCVCVGGSKNIL
jgi:hypothetical protein